MPLEAHLAWSSSASKALGRHRILGSPFALVSEGRGAAHKEVPLAELVRLLGSLPGTLINLQRGLNIEEQHDLEKKLSWSGTWAPLAMTQI